MVIAGALLHCGFFSAVAGFFGQPAATEAAFAAVCAFLSVADPPVPEDTVIFLNLALCCVAAFASSCLSCAVRGIRVAVVVLESEPTRSMAVDPRSFGGFRPACAFALDLTVPRRLVASAADAQ